MARFAIDRQIGEALIGADGFRRLSRHHPAYSPAIEAKFREAKLNLAHQKTVASGLGFGIDLGITERDGHQQGVGGGRNQGGPCSRSFGSHSKQQARANQRCAGAAVPHNMKAPLNPIHHADNSCPRRAGILNIITQYPYD